MKETREITNPKTWYDLKLGESVEMQCGIALLRVPGGWTLRRWDYSIEDWEKIETIIPFNNEFQK